MLILAVILMALLWSFWLWFMFARPEKWSSFIDWENDLAVRIGLIPHDWAPWFKGHEKGVTNKLIVGLTVFFCLVALAIILFNHR